jgi:hypothetical protein
MFSSLVAGEPQRRPTLASQREEAGERCKRPHLRSSLASATIQGPARPLAKPGAPHDLTIRPRRRRAVPLLALQARRKNWVKIRWQNFYRAAAEHRRIPLAGPATSTQQPCGTATTQEAGKRGGTVAPASENCWRRTGLYVYTPCRSLSSDGGPLSRFQRGARRALLEAFHVFHAVFWRRRTHRLRVRPRTLGARILSD